MPFLTRVKPLWDRSTLTLADLAERCNISESSASRYLNGKIIPPADIAERIIEVLTEENADEVEEMKADKNEAQNSVSIIQQIREIYQVHITNLQTTHAAQVADLRRDKLLLYITVLILVAMQVYLVIDGFHGNWGIFQYPVQ